MLIKDDGAVLTLAHLLDEAAQLGRLARPGLPRDDHDLVLADRLGDVVASLADREVGRVGDLERGGRHDVAILPVASNGFPTALR